ncbi:hypothetical protein [Micromonospora coerulea]
MHRELAIQAAEDGMSIDC